MTENNAFERFVADHLADDGAGSAQAERLAARIDDRISGRRQWPRWLAFITETPMRTNNQLAVGSPTVRVAMIIVATVLLAVSLAAVGAGAQRLMAADTAIVVSQDGSGDYATIAEAVAAAAAGDEIVVRSGTYAESVAIDKPVTVRGEGGRDSVIVDFPADGLGVEFTDGSEDDPSDPLVVYTVPVGLQLAADGVSLSGLTVSGPRPGVAIAVTGGTASLSDLAITLAGADADDTGDPAQDTRLGLMVESDTAVELRESSLDAGIEALSGSSTTIERSAFTNGFVWADEESQLVAQDNTFADAGIGSGGASATIAGNTLERGFIVVDGEGSYSVTGNHVDGLRYDVGPGVAISIWGEGDVDVSGNRVTDSDTGIKTLFFGGSARIDGNSVESTRTGISVSGLETVVSGNTIEGSDIIGLEVYSAGPTVTGNSIVNGGTGLHLATPDVATVSGNTICDNARNVRLVSGEMPDLSANDICEDRVD